MKLSTLLVPTAFVATFFVSQTEAQWPGCARCPWGRDVLPDDDNMEDECSTRNFDRVLVATTESTGVAPNLACARAVFDQICDECEDDIQCYLKLGRQVGPETRECQPRRLKYRGLKYTAAQKKCLSKCYGMRHPRKCRCACDEDLCGRP